MEQLESELEEDVSSLNEPLFDPRVESRLSVVEQSLSELVLDAELSNEDPSQELETEVAKVESSLVGSVSESQVELELAEDSSSELEEEQLPSPLVADKPKTASSRASPVFSDDSELENEGIVMKIQLFSISSSLRSV